jgi:hypothetical protein
MAKGEDEVVYTLLDDAAKEAGKELDADKVEGALNVSARYRGKRHNIPDVVSVEIVAGDEGLETLNRMVDEAPPPPKPLVIEGRMTDRERLTGRAKRYKVEIDPDALIRKLVKPKVKMLILKCLEMAEGVKAVKTTRKGEEVIYQVPPDKDMILYLLDQYLGKSAQRKKKDGDPSDKDIVVRIDDVSRPRAEQDVAQ